LIGNYISEVSVANNTTDLIQINKNTWTEIADTAHQVLVTPPEKPKNYIVFYRFSLLVPDADLINPSHRYMQNEGAEGFVTGSTETAKCWARLSPNSDFDTLDLSVAVLGEPAP
jgi:hypothetical protein